MASPLQQASPGSPAEGMVPTASGGNPMVADLQKYLLNQGEKKQTYLETQQKAYNDEMQKYATMVTQSQQPESNEAAMWGSMAGAASSVAPTWGNLGAMLGKTGEAYGNFNAKEQAQNLQSQGDLTKLRQAEVRALESKDQNAALVRAMSGGGSGKWITRVMDDQSILKINNVTGEQHIIPATQAKRYDAAKVEGLKIAIAEDVPDKDTFAENYARKQLQQMPSTPGGVISPKDVSTTSVGNKTPAPVTPDLKITPEQQALRDKAAARVREGEQSGNLPKWPMQPSEAPSPFKIDVSNLRPEDKEKVAALIKSYQDNPTEATMKRVAYTINQLLNNGSIKQVPGADATTPIAAAKGRAKEAELQAQERNTAAIEKEKVLGKNEGEKITGQPVAESKLISTLSSMDAYIKELETLKAHPGIDKAAGIMGLIPFRGRVATVGMDEGSGDAMTLLEQVKSGALMETLKEIKALSSVGASGFGSLTEKEADRIISALMAIDITKQTPGQVKRELQKVQDRMDVLRSQVKTAHERSYPKKQDVVQQASSEKPKVLRYNPETKRVE